MSARSACTAVLGLTLAALGLRFVGLGFLLPQSIALDSLVFHDEAAVLRHGGDLAYRKLSMGLYPHLIPRLVLLWPGDGGEDPPPRTLEEHLEAARAPFLRIHVVVALLSVIAVPATYALARKFLERSWSLAAAALMATSVLHLWFSQQSRPHSPQVSLALLAVLAALRLRRRPVASSYLLAGAAVAVAVGGLQNGFATLAPLAVAILLRARRSDRATPAWALASILLVAGGFRLFYPFVFEAPEEGGPAGLGRLEVEDARLSTLGNSVDLSAFNGAGFRVIVPALASYDPLISALALLGAVLLLLRSSRSRGAADGSAADPARRADFLVALAYALPCFLLVGLYQHSGERFATPLLPYLACLAAYGLRCLWHLATRTRHAVARSAAAGLVACLLAAQAFAAGKLSWIRSRPDTATRTAAWIRAHVEPAREKVLVTLPLEIPLFQTDSALRANESLLGTSNRLWFGYQSSLASGAPRPPESYELVTLPLSAPETRKRVREDALAYLRSFEADWIVIELGRGWTREMVSLLRAALRPTGGPVARYSPDRRDRWHDQPLAHQGFALHPLWRGWFWRVLEARCTGYVIEIWRVPR